MKDVGLSVGKVAEMLDGVHPETVRRYLDGDLLRGRRLPGGHRRIEASSVAELIRVMDMPDGANKDAELEALRQRNEQARIAKQTGR